MELRHFSLTARHQQNSQYQSLRKKAGEKDFYLAKDREYRSELNVFECFTKKREREKLSEKHCYGMGELKAFDTHEDELAKHRRR